MNEPVVVTGEVVDHGPAPATLSPPPVDVALAAYRAGVVEGGSLTLVYAPTVVLNAVPTAPVGAAPVRDAAPVPIRPDKRRYTLPERCFYLGMAVTGSAVAAVAVSILTGDPSLVLGVPVAAGTVLTVGSGAAINRSERYR